MPGEVSKSYEGPNDFVPFPPRWAYEHLSDAEYERLKVQHARSQNLGYPANWPRCPGCGQPAMDGHISCGRVECGEGSRRA
jgi:hypothetical protein